MAMDLTTVGHLNQTTDCRGQFVRSFGEGHPDQAIAWLVLLLACEPGFVAIYMVVAACSFASMARRPIH